MSSTRKRALNREHLLDAQEKVAYVDGWVMWPAVMFAVVGGLRGPVPAT